jgi:hypothetical protein
METTDRVPEAFADELEALKRRGCALLLVGPAAGATRCETLLGDDDRERERLVVDTARARDPSPGDDSPLVHAGASNVRSAGVMSTTPGDVSSTETPDLDADDERETSGLDAVADELIDRIDRLDAEGLKTSELRVCLGDLGTIGSDRSGDLIAFLDATIERIREAGGMGHLHLSDTSPLRATIEPLFDVTVEVRPVPDGRQQRWLLHEADLDSGWVAVRQ